MIKRTMAILLLASMLAFSGCDEKKSSLTAPNTPVARFISTVVEAANAFLVRMTNQSANHNGGTVNLSYHWIAEQKDDTTAENPEFLYSYADLNLREAGDQAIRRFTLIVTEGGDEERSDRSEQSILFERSVDAVSASVVELAPKCDSCPIYTGSEDYSGARFHGQRYRLTGRYF